MTYKEYREKMNQIIDKIIDLTYSKNIVEINKLEKDMDWMKSNFPLFEKMYYLELLDN